MKQEIDVTEQLGSKQSGNKNWPAFSYKRNIFIKKFYKECGLENSSSSFFILKSPPQKRIRGSPHADFDIF